MSWKIMTCQVKGYATIAVILFISFTIGLNLGLHGMLDIVQEDLAVVRHMGRSHSTAAVDIATPPTLTHNIENSENRVGETVVPGKQMEVPVQVISKPAVPAENSTPVIATTNSQPVALEARISEVGNMVDAYAQKVFDDVASRLPALANDHSNSDIPIILLTCNRPALLRETIKSLLAVRGVKPSGVLISQDGALPEIAAIAKESGLNLIQNTHGIRLRGGAAMDGAARIAMHYKFSLTSAFDKFKDANSVIIIEDDLLFSPDMYEYLQYTSPILDADPTAFVVSAWSDNGFKDKVKDPYALRRTDYFPGLGWLLTRRLYKEELEPKWPQSHWDHWLRAPETSKFRDIIYPQVPRTYHNGIKGTFMNLETHNKYFRDIGFNTDPTITWPPPIKQGQAHGISNNAAFIRGHHLVDQYRIEKMVAACKHVTAVTDLIKYQDEIICMWLSISTNCEVQPVAFTPLATFFGIWHEHRRGNHQGVHEFYWEGNYILLINVHDEVKAVPRGEFKTFKHLMPVHIKPLQSTEQFNKNLLAEFKRRKYNVPTTKSPTPGMNCNQVCESIGKSCKVEFLTLINTCGSLNEKFSCTRCEPSFGLEQPAYVDPSADQKFGPGQCLYNTGSDASTCEASHPSTLRLCPCI